MLIDTHSHLYDTAFDGDREQVLARVAASDVGVVMLPGIDSTTHEAMFELARASNVCLPMMGLHPTSVNDNPRWRDELAEVERHLKTPPDGIARFWGVGETGIDLHWSRDFLAEQTEAFRRQIELALEYDLPLVIHARDAWDEVFTVLEEYQYPCHSSSIQSSGTSRDVEPTPTDAKPNAIVQASLHKIAEARRRKPEGQLSRMQSCKLVCTRLLGLEAGKQIQPASVVSQTNPAESHQLRLRGVFHAFSGGIEHVQRAKALGDFVFGITGVATYKKRPLDEVIRAMSDRDFVLETDSPYLTPEPHRGTRNDSSLLPLICRRVAEIRSTTPAAIAALTTANARRLFDL